MTLQQRINSKELELAALRAEVRKESAVTAIEVPGVGVVDLREAGRAQQADAAKVQTEADVRVFESLGLPHEGAVAAAAGRPKSRW